MAELLTATLANERTVVLRPVPFEAGGGPNPRVDVLVVPSPQPTRDIAIFRSATALHVHNPVPSTEEYVFLLARASDGAIFGGNGHVIESATAALTSTRFFDERDFTPNYFRLTPGDAMLVITAAFGPTATLNDTILTTQFAAMNYALFNPDGTLAGAVPPAPPAPPTATPPPPPPPRVVQIELTGDTKSAVLALKSDGTLWEATSDTKGFLPPNPVWTQIATP